MSGECEKCGENALECDCKKFILLSEQEIKTLLTLIYNEMWDETRGEEKISLIRELTRRLESYLTKK